MVFEKIINLLLIEDEEYDVRRVQKTLEPFSDRLIIRKIVSDGRSALDLIRKDPAGFDVVIMDYQIVGGITGERLIRDIKAVDSAIQIIVITKMTINITDFEFANRLLEAGAMWYCTKYPGDIDAYIYQPTDFILSIINAYEKRHLENAKRKTDKKLQQNIENILDTKTIIGTSPVIRELRDHIVKVANQDATVMIYGASGTGKELVSSHIHYRSRRKFEKFVAINCGSLPQDLIESELFGFEKGSFTGASLKKPGLFEVANNGTVFLDEVAELPLSAQVKLLRVLQEGEIDKIGRTEKIKVNVRVIGATNKDLSRMIREGKFREDLFYRLNVVTVRVPLLKERQEDIPLLIDFFIKKFAAEMHIDPIPSMQNDALAFLTGFDWPGNVRQLQNVIQRLLLQTEQVITPGDVMKALGIPYNAGPPPKDEQGILWKSGRIQPWRDVERQMKYEYFRHVRDNTGSDAEAARQLGLAPPNYHRMCKELGLK